MRGLRVVLVLAGGLVLSNKTLATDESKKPNIIVINCDDMGYGDLSCFGNPTIKTPNLDRMALEGQKWTSFYVSASVSSPSRAGLLTGRLGVRTGMYGDRNSVLFPNSPGGLPAEEWTIAELLKQAGYHTACIGKWQLGCLPEYMPLRHGFDYFYGFPYSNDMSRREQIKMGNEKYPYEYILYEQEKEIMREPEQYNLTQLVTQAAVRYIGSHADTPFFLYLAHPMPHVPVYASMDFQGKSARGRYGDTIEELDWSVGQILWTLKEKGLDGNTLVIFTSDNGPWLSYKQSGGSAGPLKDGKSSAFEGGFRVPCIMWGAMVQPGQITDMASTFASYMTFDDGIMNGTDLYLGAGDEYSLSDYAYSIPFRLRVREACHRVLYVIANYSASMNGLKTTTKVIPIMPWWQVTLNALVGVTAGLTAVGAVLWVLTYVFPEFRTKKKEKTDEQIN